MYSAKEHLSLDSWKSCETPGMAVHSNNPASHCGYRQIEKSLLPVQYSQNDELLA